MILILKILDFIILKKKEVKSKIHNRITLNVH